MQSLRAIICMFLEFRENFGENKSNLREFQIQFEIFMKMMKICEIVRKTAEFEFGEVQKNANLVDLEKC